jgi:hypothetical protein
MAVRSMSAPRFSRRAAITTLAAAGLGVACRAPNGNARPTLSLDVIAERYVRLTLEFAQHQPSLVEAWLGPQGWRPGPRRPVAQLRGDLNAIRSALPASAENQEHSERLSYLRGQIEALWVAARRLSGESMRFVDEARAAFGDEVANLVEGPLRDAQGEHTDRVAARDVLDERLPGEGAVHERYAAFRHAHAIPRDRVLPALTAAMEICRKTVLQHIPLPSDEHVALAIAQGMGLQGRASYAGEFRSNVQFDPSGGLDLARLVWLAAHETYPGHHVQHVLAARDVTHARGWHERALHPAFGAHLLIAEGAAETGAALLLDGAAFEDICRELAPVAGVPAHSVRELVDVYRAVTDLDTAIVGVAQRYLDAELGTEAAAEQLESGALVADARGFLFTIERQRTRLLAYPMGRRLISARVFGAPRERRWDRFAQISTWLTITA